MSTLMELPLTNRPVSPKDEGAGTHTSVNGLAVTTGHEVSNSRRLIWHYRGEGKPS
jgi:hypothetical protein